MANSLSSVKPASPSFSATSTVGLLEIDAAEAVMIKKRRCGREEERQNRRLSRKETENAEGSRGLEERERDGLLRAGVLKEAMIDV